MNPHTITRARVTKALKSNHNIFESRKATIAVMTSPEQYRTI